MSWHTARDQQTMLVELWRSQEGLRYGKHFLDVTYERGITYADSDDNLATVEEPKIATAEPIFVEPEVIDLIEHARESFEPETLLAEDVFIPWGFAFFARTVYMRDRNGKRMGFRAAAWAPYVKRRLADSSLATVVTESPENAMGLLISLYSHIDDEDDFAWKSQDQTYRRYPLWLAHFAHTPFGSHYEAQLEDAAANSLARETAKDFHGFVQVFFRLLQQKIAVKRSEVAPRPSRKRAQRAGLPERKVLVVTLRRASNPLPKNGDAGFEYSHRFVVGGHWHTYWHGSGDSKYPRQHWVYDYVKGPEDKELVIKDRAFDFSR
jgi:hypothetical protein